MNIKNCSKKNLPRLLKATISNLLAYDCKDLNVSPGQILDFQIYTETLSDFRTGDEDFARTFGLLNSLFETVMRRIEEHSKEHLGDIARIFLKKQELINNKYGNREHS